MLQYIYILGIAVNMYKFFFGVALSSVPVVLFLLRKKFGYSKRQAAFYSAFTLVFGLIAAFLTGVLKRLMLGYASGWEYQSNEILRNYGIPIFLPLFWLIYCRIRKVDFGKLTDYIAPCVYSVMFFVKIGCVFWGCCYGEPDEHGIWNESLGYKTFPVQLYDTITSLLIVVVCVILIYRLRDRYSGYIYPIGGILFALTKGFWESFRVHTTVYERDFMNTGWTLWQYWMLMLLIGCVIWLTLTVRRAK